MENIGIILIALLLDVLIGEIPNRFHPVAWLGSLINLQLKHAPASGKTLQFVYGLSIVLATICIVTIPLAFLIFYLHQFNNVVYVLVSACILKSTFSVRGLWSAVKEVEILLKSQDIAAARESVRALVSRDTGTLSEKQVISASVESCAENICDSFIAPLFYFAVFGLPGAIAYRIINTFDAMIGYRGRWEYTGKFAALLDDAANFLPARLSGLLISLSAVFTRNGAGQAWQTMWKEHGQTKSPNAGWPMAAMAGSLGVTLEKVGHYRLGQGFREISITDVDRSQRILLTAAGLWCMLMIIIEVIKLVTAKATHI